jgi:arylsulfatase A-like enzyme
VIFSSDNGGVGGYAREGLRKNGDVTDNAPLRGGKGMLYEGGIRVPWVFRWPGVIAAGTRTDQPIHSIDLYPTLLRVAGAASPPGVPLDGTSFLPVLKDARKKIARDSLFWHFPGYLGAGPDTWRTTPVGVVRSGDWKLIEFFENGRLELYNLAKDLGEKNDLAGKMPGRVKELHENLRRWRKELNAPMPTVAAAHPRQ